MKILFLTPQIPYPPQKGTSMRNWGLISGLAERHQVSVLSFLDPGQSPVLDDITFTFNYSRPRILYYRSGI